MSTATATSPVRDETQLRQFIADQMSAIGSKDLDRLMDHYAADVVVFDVKPPFQTIGADAVRRLWEECLPSFPDHFQIEARDLHLAVGDDLARGHWIFRLTGMEEDHPGMQTWMRISAGYRRIGGRWMVVHEHVSVPFDPQTAEAAFTLEPQSSR